MQSRNRFVALRHGLFCQTVAPRENVATKRAQRQATYGVTMRRLLQNALPPKTEVMVINSLRTAILAAFVFCAGNSVAAAPTYADLADLTAAAPVIVRATVAKTARIKLADSPDLAPGLARLLYTVNTNAALIAPESVPSTLIWLYDAPLDARGKLPKTKGQPLLAWIATPAADGKSRLVATGAQQPWDADLEARTRAIATEMRSGTVPTITGVANGFRADGTVAGESESQFFLTTADGGNLTMIVTARPGMRRSIAVAKGDLIDESATSVKPDTLLWYRLACFLPATLPREAGGDDTALAADWRSAIESLGRCERSL